MGDLGGSNLFVIAAVALVLFSFVGMIVKKAGKAIILPSLGLILLFTPLACAALTK